MLTAMGLVYLGCVVLVADEIRKRRYKPTSATATFVSLVFAPIVIVSVLAVSAWLFFFDVDPEEDSHD